MDKLGPAVGIDALIIGSGPTGLILAQLLKLNGAHRIVIAANKGIKVELAKQLEAGDEYLELDRENPSAQWEELKQKNPYGFDVVASICLNGWRRGELTVLVWTGRGDGLGGSRKRRDQLRPQRRHAHDLRRVQQRRSRALASLEDFRRRD